MIPGLFFLTIGYAIFYWGIHHFPPSDPNNDASWPRYPLKCVLGIQSLQLPTLQGLGDQWSTAVKFAGPINTTPGATPQQPQGPQGNAAPQNLGKAPTNWPNDILNGLGAPTSKNNTAKLIAWNACEGNDNNQSGLPINNPFNVTHSVTESDFGGTLVPGNSAGVLNYPTWSAGVEATVIRIGQPFATAIKYNLQRDGTCADFANAVGSSGWGTRGACIAAYCGYTGTT